MALPNRVAPDGTLHAVPARGLFTGNRGIIHDPATRAPNGRRWTTPAWICCALDWKGARREVWGRNRDGGKAGWSQLFFLDEVTALAAGHRPCFHCRREAATAFMACYDAGNGLSGRDAGARDAILHAERRLSSREPPQPVAAVDLAELPEGTMVEAGGNFFAMRKGRALRWDFSGYGAPGETGRAPVVLVTPRSVVQALRRGYRPVWHATAA